MRMPISLGFYVHVVIATVACSTLLHSPVSLPFEDKRMPSKLVCNLFLSLCGLSLCLSAYALHVDFPLAMVCSMHMGKCSAHDWCYAAIALAAIVRAPVTP